MAWCKLPRYVVSDACGEQGQRCSEEASGLPLAMVHRLDARLNGRWTTLIIADNAGTVAWRSAAGNCVLKSGVVLGPRGIVARQSGVVSSSKPKSNQSANLGRRLALRTSRRPPVF
jgi:hypothetical protein